jgi:hypothetical protein
MAGLHGSLEKVLQANAGKDYCASCLAATVGLCSAAAGRLEARRKVISQ